MNDSHDPTLRAAVLEWQQKHGVKEDDPLLASLELFQIYFASWQRGGSGGSSASSYDEFRSSFEALEQRARDFSKQATELMEALRKTPNLSTQLQSYRLSTLWIIAVLALGVGISIGRMFP